MDAGDFEKALEEERLGDAAEARQAATGHYREAQQLLLPVGVQWTCREDYDRRQEAFERIQEKIYGLHQEDRPAGSAMQPQQNADALIPHADAPPPTRGAAPTMSVPDFYPGLKLRVCQSFHDFDGRQIFAGEILHMVSYSYFPHDDGHTLKFAEKTIRLAGFVDQHDAIVENVDNAWFQPLLSSTE